MVFIAFSTWRRKGRQFSGTIPPKILSLSTFSSFFRDLLISVCRRRFHPYVNCTCIIPPPPSLFSTRYLNAAIQKKGSRYRYKSIEISQQIRFEFQRYFIVKLNHSMSRQFQRSCVSVCTWFLLHHFYLFEGESQQIFGHPEWLQITTGTQ